MVQGEARGSRHDGGRVWWRHGALHPVISSLIAERGYQATFVATGIFQGLVIRIVAQVLRHPPVQPAAAAPAAAPGTPESASGS